MGCMEHASPHEELKTRQQINEQGLAGNVIIALAIKLQSFLKRRRNLECCWGIAVSLSLYHAMNDSKPAEKARNVELEILYHLLAIDLMY